MFRRRRPLMRAAIVGGSAYAVGKHVQGNRDEAAAEQEAAIADAAPDTEDVYAQLDQLAALHEKGVLTDSEFEVQKHKLLERT